MTQARFPLRQVVWSGIADIAAPVVIYYSARAAGLDEWLALLLGAVPPLAQCCYTLAREKSADWLSIVVLTIILASAATSLITGSPRFLLAKDGLLTGCIGITLLASLRAQRPALFALGRMMVRASGHSTDDWDAHWERSAPFRRVWRQLTVLWAAGVLLDAALRVLLAYALPIDMVPVLSVVLWLVLLIALQVISQLALRRPHIRPLVFTG